MVKGKVLLITFVILFTGCCRRRAERGIDIIVIDKGTGSAVANVNVFIHDVQHSDSGPLVDAGYTDSNGQVHLKLSEKCSHYLDISCSGNSDYYGEKYEGSTHTTRTLPKKVQISLQHK